jgi:hypothetical protein
VSENDTQLDTELDTELAPEVQPQADVTGAEPTITDLDGPVDGELDAPAADAHTALSEPAQAESAADPIEEFKRQLRLKDGDWYVVHSYAGYEKRVKTNLETRIQSLNMEDFIFEIEVPMEEVTEIKNGQKKLVSRVRMPGYVLVRMDLTDESWGAVRHTPVVPPGSPRSLRSLTSRSASPSPSWRVRSRPSPRRSPRSTPTPRSSRCSSRSSAGRRRSSCPSRRSPRSEPTGGSAPR